jgi:hypothetical protein
VAGFSGANGQDLDTDDDGTFDVTPWTAIVDLIALIVEDNPPSGTEFHYGPPTVGPDGGFVPGHAIFCPTRWEVGSFELGDDTPGAVNACPAPPIFLNEVDSDTPGLDGLEFVEIFEADGNAPLDGLVVVFYNGSSDTSYAAFDLDGFTTGADGFFVLGNSGLTPAPGLVFGDNTLQNGADAVALNIGNATDFPDGTPVTTFNLVDALVYDTDDGDDAGLLVLLNAGQEQVNEAGGGDSPGDSNQRCPNGFGGQRNTDAYAQASPSPGALNNCPPLEIFEIQGDGLASLYDGFVVNTADNVVTAVGVDGFFMQTPAARSDGDVDTSDGIFVFTGGAPTDDMGNPIQFGDLVDVTGPVQEFFDFTELGFGSSVTVTGSGLVPPAVVFDATVPSPDPSFPSCAIEFECYEGMRVTIADGTVTGPNQRFNTDVIAEVYITAASSRTFREPGILFPGLLGLPVWDGNPEVFELDPDKLGLPNQIIPAGSSFSATGAIGFEFGGYELWPTELTVVPAPLPVPVRAAAPGELTVATLNLFRLFDDVDDPPSVRFDGALRNDTVVSTAEYLRRLTKVSAYVREVLRSPDVLAVQEAEKLEVLEDLAARIELDDPAVVYTAYLVEGNDIGTIDVGFLVRERIAVDAVTQLGLTELLSVDGSPLHDRPPLLLEGSCELAFGSYPIAVMVLHQRSLGGIEDPVDGDRVRQKRYEQAESVALKVQALQTADPDVRLLVVGDFNAYEFSDGYVDVTGIMKGDFVPADNLVCDTNTCADLVEPDLFDEVLGLAAAERYSFLFDGSAQVLDHALTSQGLADEVSGAEYGRGNSDAALDLINDGTTPGIVALRSSDHDGMVVYLLEDEDADGVPNNDDVCPGTVIPESVPTRGLNPNRYALVDGDGVFDTPGGGAGDVFTLGDTAGCSCEQIIAAQGLGNGHVKHGCSVGAMRNWVDLVNP